MHTGTTLTQFIIEEQRRTAGATGDFTSLLNDVVIACKAISNVVNKGALLGVMTSGQLRGVMIGAIISLVQLLQRASRPHVAFLGRIPGTRRFSGVVELTASLI